MPVLYKIVPSLNLIYYYCYGHCTGPELGLAEWTASQDALRQPSMVILTDLINISELDLDLDSVRGGIKMNEQRIQQGLPLEPTAFITQSRVAETMGEVYQLLAVNIPLTMAMFQTLKEAVIWLGLADHEAEILQIRSELEVASIQR